jgi:hypothetical protein
VRGGVLRGTPVDPSGTPFSYDPASHTVTLSTTSSLWPLPPAFTQQK